MVRPAGSTDRPAVADVVTRAFGDEGPTVAALVGALSAGGHVRSELVADSDGRIVGHVMLSRSWVDARQALVDVLVLSPLSVDPAHQGRGIGTALLAGAVEAARDLGSPAVFRLSG